MKKDVGEILGDAGKKLSLAEVEQLDAEYSFKLFSRAPVCFERGEGTLLFGSDGKRYLDFLGGIAVNALGHSHPAIVGAIREQAGKFIHCSNLYYIEPQARLARTLADISCADRVFFCNSGAEANEAALKLAKIYRYKAGQPKKRHIITASDSFHGRTLATVAATGQPKYQKPYEPLTPGFEHVPFNNIEALRAAASKERTNAIMLELVQGESGVNIASRDYVQAAAAICKKLDILLILDEVQTGLGRTGKLFAYEHYGVEPDIFTLAKALGAGFPIGAMLAKGDVAEAFGPGDHGSTFAGNPLACSVGNAAVGTILREGLHDAAAEKGAYLLDKLRGLKANCPAIREVRGIGLMAAAEFSEPVAAEIKDRLLHAGCLVGSVGASILRLLPPLTVSRGEIDEAVGLLEGALKPL
ncbi:MAG: aspartate aminotransferase family protein [Clostridiales bacterium]|jgi:acetylornithine aminotransferase/acetylornithine/N-succinyldiaminopimelate aminotransferase|nr:aspartate aminotransferase family protein [Clostridiales bacterium]